MEKKWEVTDLKRTCPEEHLSLTKSGFASEEGYNGCKSQNIANLSEFGQLVRLLKEQVCI